MLTNIIIYPHIPANGCYTWTPLVYEHCYREPAVLVDTLQS